MRINALTPFLVAVSSVCCWQWATPAFAARTFCDSFRPTASADWGNQRGAWRTGQGQYDASSPSNGPLTYTDLTPYQNLTKFTVWVTVNDLNDGGVWLRSHWNGGAINGVLLVTGGDTGSNNGFYWHVVTNGVPGSQLQNVSVPGIQGTNVALKIVVSGKTYKLYMAGSSTPLSTLIDGAYASGSVGLYDYSPTSGAGSPRGETFSHFCLEAR
jgi:hypothetical protein